MKVIDKKIISDIKGTRVTQLEVEASHIVAKAEPGQFIMVMVSEDGERIPLTVVKKDKARGTITMIFQELGFTTKLLGKCEVGDAIYAISGPLGHATEIKSYGKVIIIGGGVGIAEIYPVAKGFKDAGNDVLTIIGARQKDLLILEEELKGVSSKLHIATDDGSYGEKGFVTDILKKELEAGDSQLIYAVGPIPMMEKVAEVSQGKNIKTLVSLNALMVDGTGMCGCCRVKIGDEVKFSCVDGPEFDAHEVDWQELMSRADIYKEKEEHICKLGNI